MEQNWGGPAARARARAKRFYIRGTKPDTSVKKGVMAMHELLAARCLLLAAWRFVLATNTILTNTCLYHCCLYCYLNSYYCYYYLCLLFCCPSKALNPSLETQSPKP